MDVLYSTLGILVAAVQVVLTHASDPRSVEVRYSRSEKFIKECVEGGFEFRTRFKFRVCEGYRSSYRNCNEESVFIQTLSYEPLPGIYLVGYDALGDEDPPNESTFVQTEQAYEKVLTLNTSALNWPVLSKELRKFDKPIMNVAVDSHCKGEYNLTLARISRFLTLGMLSFGEDTSGWIIFDPSDIMKKAR